MNMWGTRAYRKKINFRLFRRCIRTTVWIWKKESFCHDDEEEGVLKKGLSGLKDPESEFDALDKEHVVDCKNSTHLLTNNP